MKNKILTLLLLAVIIVLIILLVKKNKVREVTVTPENNQVVTMGPEQTKPIHQLLFKVGSELESERYEFPTKERVILWTGESVYNDGDYYSLYMKGSSVPSVRIYKNSSFQCSNIPEMALCNQEYRVVLIQNDQSSKDRYQAVLKGFQDKYFQTRTANDPM